MTNLSNALRNSLLNLKNTVGVSGKLGAIVPNKVVMSDWGDFQEACLIQACKAILAANNMEYSEAAIRDLPDVANEVFDPRSAATALQNAGLTASFGSMDPSGLVDGHCPAIGFSHTGCAVLVMARDESDGAVHIREIAESGLVDRVLTADMLSQELMPYFILIKAEHEAKKVRRANDWLWTALAQSKWVYWQVILAAFLSNLLMIATPIFIMTVYDRVVPNQATDSLIVLAIGALIALGFDFILKSLRAKLIDRASRRADGRMARMIFDKILTMPLDKKRSNAGAMASIVREFDTLREFFTSATLVAIVDLPFVFLFVGVIYLICGPLAAVPLSMVPLTILSVLIVQPMLARISEGAMKSNMSKQGVLIETLNGLETIKATGSGRLMRDRFEAASDVQSELGLETRSLSQFAINATSSLIQLNMILTVFFGVFLMQAGTITMGAMIAAVVLGSRALTPLAQLTAALTRANAARQAYRSISDLMTSDLNNDAMPEGPRLSRPKLSGSIELRGVTYTFPGAKEPVLRNLSIKIPAGQKVAVLGKMGSGKSTLVRLLSGIVEPTSGAVLIDGVDIRQLDKSDLRRNVGVMLQENWLFSGTIKENLRMGFFEYDDAHILEAAKVSGVDDFISGRPEGYDMELREKGEGLSGGQRQSINLARAIIHDPTVLVMDEPTSSMDTASEKALIERLKIWGADRTMVIVTHRATLLDLVDRVLFVQNGVITADTTPDKIREKQAG